MPDQEIVIKSVPAMWIVSLRGTVPDYPDQKTLWMQISEIMQRSGIPFTEPCFTLDHDEEHKERDHDLEVSYPQEKKMQVDAPATCRQLPAVESMASLLHHGPFNTLYQSYQQMLKWLDANGYQICGPGREIYLETNAHEARQDDPSYVTEIQFPVQKG